MHSPEGNFTGNDTTSEIILFEVPSNRCSSTGGVEVVGRECPRAKAESKKQCIDPESTSVQMGIGWRWSGAHTRGETRGIQREFGSERADAVTPLENFLRKCNMGYTLYPWISLLESTLETSYKPQT